MYHFLPVLTPPHTAEQQIPSVTPEPVWEPSDSFHLVAQAFLPSLDTLREPLPLGLHTVLEAWLVTYFTCSM